MNSSPYMRFNLCSIDQNQKLGAKTLAIVLKTELDNKGSCGGYRLPPVRVLAHQLNLSKNTVQEAYEELVAMGSISNRKRVGFFVNKGEMRNKKGNTVKVKPAIPSFFPPALEPRRTHSGDKISLSSVFIDQTLLPKKQITQCLKSVLSNPGVHTFYDTQGFPPLREAIAKRLNKRGIPANASDIITTVGSQQALDIVCRAMTGNRVAVESPAYYVGKQLFVMNKMKLSGLPLDPFRGIDLKKWQEIISNAKPDLLYITSNFQNPTGYSYSTNELTAILKWSEQYGFGIIEDDWGSDMLSFSEYREPLRSLGGENVLYMNSFTKKLLPSLRIGYLLANEKITPSLIEAKRAATLANPTLIEAALFEFLDRGYYDAHLKKLQQALDNRYRNCLEVLKHTMPSEVRWTKSGGGPILWLELPKNVDLDDLQVKLEKQDVIIQHSTLPFHSTPHLHGFKIGYAYLPEKKLNAGLEILGAELKKCLSRQ